MLAGIVGCTGREARVKQPETGRAVDSLVPREVALQKFREGLPRVDSLAGGATSRDALVAAFVRALGEEDTTALAEMAITPSEFAYLYYPTAAEGKPPYDLEPSLMWFMLYERSNQGLRKALQRYGGARRRLVNYDCGSTQVHEGENTISGPCVIRWEGTSGDTVAVRLFSKILERSGRSKFLSYSNPLD